MAKQRIETTQQSELIGFLYSIYPKEWLTDCQTFNDFLNVIDFELTEYQKRIMLNEWNKKEEIISYQKQQQPKEEYFIF